MKVTRRQLRKLIAEVVVASDDAKQKADELEQELRKDNPDASDDEIAAALDKLAESKTKEVTLSQVDKAIIDCLKKEGGAAGMGMLVDAVMSLETKSKKLPKNLSSKAKIKKYIAKHPKLLIHKYKDIILVQGLPRRK